MRIEAGVTPQSHLYRVLLDDIDVSKRCVVADDHEGWADCVMVDGDGEPVFNRIAGGPKIERLRGRVEFRKD